MISDDPLLSVLFSIPNRVFCRLRGRELIENVDYDIYPREEVEAQTLLMKPQGLQTSNCAVHLLLPFTSSSS